MQPLLATLAAIIAIPAISAAQGTASKDPDAEARRLNARCRQGDQRACRKLQSDVSEAIKNYDVAWKMICDDAKKKGKPASPCPRIARSSFDPCGWPGCKRGSHDQVVGASRPGSGRQSPASLSIASPISAPV